MYNERAIRKVLTCLYNDNDLIVSPEHPFRLEDFALKKYQAIYSALYNLYASYRSFFDIISFVGIFQVRLFSLSCTSFSIFCLLFFENKLKIKSLNLDIKIPQ